MARRALLCLAAAAALLVPAGLGAAAPAAGFSFADKAGEHLDVVLGGRVVVRYMYAYDKSSPARLLETYKPYLHVFDPEGQAPITKGPGGNYTHHRGVFVGWNRLGFGGKSYDRWHMKGGEQVHQKFAGQRDGPAEAAFTSLVHWNDEAGQPVVVEERTTTVRRAPAPAYLLIDLVTRLSAPRGDVVLDGDPEHAGVQYRPAAEVDAKQTVYVFPREGADPKKDTDYPWVGETYTLGDKRYSVVHFNHPDNPKGTVYSAYRDYGRFGAFFKKDIRSGESLTLKYRFLVAAGEMPPIDAVQKCWDQFAGAATPSPTPKTTVAGGAQQSGGAPKTPAKPKAPAQPKAKAAGA